MPLQQLVEYFNDRLEQEHSNRFRPFILTDGKVQGLFGPISVGTALSPVRETLHSSKWIGHVAQLIVSANPVQTVQDGELDILLKPPHAQDSGSDSVINFDRLTRTVHMLNYLPQSHLDELLFLYVDPRHILGVKEDHGAYFEEIIIKCGLQTGNVAIALAVNNTYSRFYPSLLKGLENYQRRGYRLALKFDVQSLEKTALELISRLSPDFVGLSAEHLDQVRDNQLLGKIQQLNSLVASVNGRSLLLDVADKRSAALARQSGFDLVQGRYFELPVTSANKRDAAHPLGTTQSYSSRSAL